MALTRDLVKRIAHETLLDLDWHEDTDFYQEAMYQVMSGVGFWDTKDEIVELLEDYNDSPSLLFYWLNHDPVRLKAWRNVTTRRHDT